MLRDWLAKCFGLFLFLVVGAAIVVVSKGIIIMY
jgi:hypothetical protein